MDTVHIAITTPDSTHSARAALIRSQPRPSTIALTRLAIEEQTAFDAVITSDSQAMFPSMQEERSALRVLAKP